jgi:polyisoprenoid-binding protein YceI
MADTDLLVRTVDDRTIPTPGVFTLDPSHSVVGFSVRHMMIAKVRGQFSDFSGKLEVAEDPLDSTLSVEVRVDSVDTRDEQRDGHLRSGDFFDVENHPVMSFTATAVKAVGGDRFVVEGDLTVRGVTRPVTLDATYNGLGQDPWGNQRIGIEATAEVDREDFGLTWNQALETGGVLVGKAVKIEIDAQFVRS